MLAFVLLASLQDPLPPPPPPPADFMATVGQIIQAWQGKQYVLVGAFVIGLIVAASKTGWLGNWLATQLPSQARPFLAVIVGILTVASTETISGVEWKLALLHSFYAAATAVLGHQMVVEGLRGGKEIMPMRPGTPAATIPPPPPPPPAGGSTTGDSGPPVMRISRFSPVVLGRRAIASFAGVALVALTTGCGAWWQNFLKDPVGQMTAFVQYVLGFIESTKSLWALIVPNLGSSATDANLVFTNLMASLQHALAVAEDAVQVAVDAQQPTIDIAALIKPVQDVIQQILTTIATWKPSAPASPAIGAGHDDVTHQGTQLLHWHFHQS